MELISVIVPIYNIEQYLPACIESIRSQSYYNIEIILVDDGSKDGSLEVCKKFESIDDRIRVIHKSNGGLSTARNVGIESSRGCYLAFVDGDDYIHPDMLRTLYDNLKNYASEISCCSFRKVYHNGGKIELADDLIQDNVNYYTGDDKFIELYKNNINMVIAGNKIYDKKLFRSIRYPEGRLHEDEYIIHELLFECNRIVFTSRQMYFYVQRSGSIMNEGGALNIKSYEEDRKSVV